MTLETLKRYRPLCEEITALKEESKKIKLQQDMEKDPEIKAELEKIYVSLCDQCNLYTRLVLRIEDSITALPVEYRNIMRLYYIDGLTWEEVAEKTNYCVRQLTRKRDKALEQMSITESAEPDCKTCPCMSCYKQV